MIKWKAIQLDKLVAVYPKGAWTTSTLQTARALGTTVGGNTVDVSGTTVIPSGLEFV